MIRGENILTPKTIEAALKAKAKRVKDGSGLELRVDEKRARWVWRFTLAGRDREFGCGSHPETSLALARTRRDDAREILRNGVDPIAVKARNAPGSEIPVFGAAARAYIEKHGKSWNATHRGQWEQTTGPYCASIASKPVDQITTFDIEKLLAVVHAKAPVTAHRLRGRIESVIDGAWMLHRWSETLHNPAAFRKLLPTRETAVRHHPAIPYGEIPAFVADLQKIDSITARALELTLLCATRAGETLGARWEEFDVEKRIWTVPADRMKGRAGKRRAHQIPLCDRALAIVEELGAARENAFVFPGREGGHLSVNSLIMRMRRLRPKMTVHGLRSSFRDWAGDVADVPREVAEAALAHRVGGVEGAYRRGSALDRRARLMEQWGAYCAGPQPAGNVVPLPRRA